MYAQNGCLVHIYLDGSVLINHAGIEMGQGLHTKMLQVVSTELGVPMSRIRVADTYKSFFEVSGNSSTNVVLKSEIESGPCNTERFSFVS